MARNKKTLRSRFARLWPKPLWAQVLLVLAVLAVPLVVFSLVLNSVRSFSYTATATPPAVGTIVLAPGLSKAQQALEDHVSMDAAEHAATVWLAAQPTAYWVTPEQDPPGTAGGTVQALALDARAHDVALALVIYGLPERDCGNHSAGGLADDAYLGWVGEIAGAMKNFPDVQKIVVLEPDSLALAPECGNEAERVEQLRAAVKALTGPDTWIYLDGGHSGWHAPAEMARLIRSVGAADSIRGFATNVSNYRSTFDEFAYARAVATEAPGLHAIIDTARNGAATAGSEWCNPPGQHVGEPGGTYGDDVIDTNLWIKPPGESDGPCHGGPAPGVWWPAGALDLTRDISTQEHPQ